MTGVLYTTWCGRSILITTSVGFVYISRRIRRREQNLIIRNGKSEAEVTMRSRYGTDRHEASRGLSATCSQV